MPLKILPSVFHLLKLCCFLLLYYSDCSHMNQSTNIQHSLSQTMVGQISISEVFVAFSCFFFFILSISIFYKAFH